MVKLTLKNLQQQTFTIEIDLTASVKELKEKIEKERGMDYPSVGQKLIYAGKILQDDNNLESYHIDANKFLVIMVTKPKSAAVTPESGSGPPDIAMETSQPENQPSASPTTADAQATSMSSSESTTTATTTAATSKTDTASTETTSAPSSTDTHTSSSSEAPADDDAASGPGNAESLLVMGEEFNRMVENIMEMGYERTQVERALRASFNNPYTAVQYLVDGLPDNIDDAPPSTPPSGNPVATGQNPPYLLLPQPEGEEGEGGRTAGDGEDDPLAFLRNQPQFIQMTQMMRSNPQLLDAFFQQIRQTNPDLLQVIQQNQEAFVRMLNEPPRGGETGGTGGRGGGTEGGGGRGESRPQNTIMVTPQDRDAIDRLRALGNFPEELVIQAYFACEKNENLAAEFLFSQSWD